jgi:hypothetical protein
MQVEVERALELRELAELRRDNIALRASAGDGKQAATVLSAGRAPEDAAGREDRMLKVLGEPQTGTERPEAGPEEPAPGAEVGADPEPEAAGAPAPEPTPTPAPGGEGRVAEVRPQLRTAPGWCPPAAGSRGAAACRHQSWCAGLAAGCRAGGATA